MEIMTIIIIALAVVVTVKYESIINYFGYSKWKKQIEGKHNYSEDSIRKSLTTISETGFRLQHELLPYGRAMWFINCNQGFRDAVENEEIEYFGFSPIRSKEELEFKEYGILLTNEGIFASSQSNESSNKGKQKEYITTSEFLPFKGLWKIRFDDNKKLLVFYYRKKIKRIIINEDDKYVRAIIVGIKNMIDSGYTNDIDTGYIKNKIEQSELSYRTDSIASFNIAQTIGTTVGIYSNIENHVHNHQINSIVNASMGHGHAAEYANNLIDKIKHPLLNVEQVGQNNARNGADRVVGDQLIQTKYCSNARNTVNSAFEKKVDGGQYRYSGMQLEVPKDQYNEAIKVMQERISEGKVPGYTNPEDAYKIIRKGNITYNESKLITQGGNITSIKYDALDGAIQSLPIAGISFVIVFAQAKWSGMDTKDAVTLAVKAGLRTLIIGTVVYAGSQQFAKIMTAKIAEQASKKILAQSVAKNFGLVFSFSIVVAPNLFDSLRGRISKQQLLKNTLIAGSGFAAGMAAGAVGGSIVPGVGNVVGGVIGGIVGSIASKKILDNFLPDDRVEMFAQL